MIWIDIALKGVAVASTVIATLQAGSRAVYLMEHDAIGIMEGPVISPNRTVNETNPLFELSEAFRHTVRLSIAPHFYHNVVQRQKSTKVAVEPYTLSPLPYLDSKSNNHANDYDDKVEEKEEEADGDGDVVSNHNSTPPQELLTFDGNQSSAISQNNISFFRRQYIWTKSALSAVPSSLLNTGRAVVGTPKTASNWARRMYTSWKWKLEEEEEYDLVDGTVESDWDYNQFTEAQLKFNSSEGVPRVAELSVFSPQTFQNLRSMFGVSETSFRQSIFASGPFVSFQSNSKGAARVGGVFFFTRDGAYMIKTIKKEEAKTFLEMLPKYHKHMAKHRRSSLLTRFCGMYGVRIYDEDSLDHGQLHTFVVMNAVFPAEASRFIGERFDLKGSTVGREVSEEELKKKGKDAVLKDNDLAREVALVRSVGEKDLGRPPTEYGLNIGATAKAALLSQLREDVKLLVDCQVMDYSLLVGVVDMETHLQLDMAARKALGAMQTQGRQLAMSKKWQDRTLWALGAPIRLVSAPPVFLGRQIWNLSHRTLSTIITSPLPYYGSGKCGVYGGLFSILHGRRNSHRATYYIGLIDFLQPWTTRKVLERTVKGLMGHDTNAISCVTPEEYASRFLEYLDANVS